MKKLVIAAICTLLFLAVGVLFAALDLNRFSHAPLKQSAEMKTVWVRPGQDFAATTRQLVQAGIIDKPLRLRIFARLHGYDKQVRAGEYRLSAAMPPADILETLTAGRVILYRLTVPEGYSMVQIAGLVAKTKLVTETDFLSGLKVSNSV